MKPASGRGELTGVRRREGERLIDRFAISRGEIVFVIALILALIVQTAVNIESAKDAGKMREADSLSFVVLTEYGVRSYGIKKSEHPDVWNAFFDDFFIPKLKAMVKSSENEDSIYVDSVGSARFTVSAWKKTLFGEREAHFSSGRFGTVKFTSFKLFGDGVNMDISADASEEWAAEFYVYFKENMKPNM